MTGAAAAGRPSLGRFTAVVVGALLLAAAFAIFHLFDFRIFYDASNRLLDGKHLYPSAAEIDARTRDYYVLPPVMAFVTVPLSFLPFVLAGFIYAAATIAAVLGAMRVLGVTDPRCYVALLFWVPMLQTVGLGTVEPLLVLLLALSWRHRDRAWLGSAALGLAIAAKLFLWPVLLWLLVTRRIRRTVEASVVAAAAVLVPWAIMGFRELTWYPHMLRLLVKTEQATGWGIPASSLFSPPVLLADVACVVAIAAAARAADGDRKAFSASVIASLVVSPLVWLHYYVVLLVPIALASPAFGPLWVVPVLACWPFTDSHRVLGVKLWGYAILALVAWLTLRSGTGAPLRLGRGRPALSGRLP